MSIISDIMPLIIVLVILFFIIYIIKSVVSIPGNIISSILGPITGGLGDGIGSITGGIGHLFDVNPNEKEIQRQIQIKKRIKYASIFLIFIIICTLLYFYSRRKNTLYRISN